MDENELYEKKREEALNALKNAYEDVKEKLSGEERDIFEKIIESLSLISTGVDAAHRRIRIRKQELEKLDKSLHKIAKSNASLIEAIRLFSFVQKQDTEDLKQEFAKLSKANARFLRIVCVSALVMVGFMAFLAIGGQNVISSIDGMATALKTINMIM